MKNNDILNKNERISKARKMFKVLGWNLKWLYGNDILEIVYLNLNYHIYLHMITKEIEFVNNADDAKQVSLSLDELKALNTLIFDLGWYQK